MTSCRYSEIALGSHVFVPANEVGSLSRARRACTVIDRYEERSVPIYSEVGDWFGFPRYWFDSPEKLSDTVHDLRSAGGEISFSMRRVLHSKQELIFRRFNEHLDSGKTGFLLVADPGWGKTVMAISMIARLGVTALVVVPSAPLINQWVDEFLGKTTLTRDDIGTVVGRRASWKGKKVVIALVHSLRIGYLGKEFNRYFGQVWYDEIHSSVPPETFAPAAGQFPAIYRGGLTATPDRKDGLDAVFEKHIAQITLRGTDANRMKPTVLAVNYRGHSGSFPSSQSKAARGIFVSRLARNIERNKVIAYFLALLLNSDRRCAAISERTQQLYVLGELLHNSENTDSIGFFLRKLDIPSVITKTFTNAELDHTKKNSSLILATYGMMKQGTDIPDLAGLVYATPQTDPRQSKGRIERWVDGKQSPILVDLIDVQYPALVAWYGARARWYRDAGLTVKRMEVPDDAL